MSTLVYGHRVTTSRRTIRIYIRSAKSTYAGTYHQQVACLHYAAKVWPTAPVAVYEDDNTSGLTPFDERPGMTRLMSHWNPGDALLVERYTVLTRDDNQHRELTAALGGTEFELVSATESNDLAQRYRDKVMAEILAYERAERIARGKSRKC